MGNEDVSVESAEIPVEEKVVEEKVAKRYVSAEIEEKVAKLERTQPNTHDEEATPSYSMKTLYSPKIGTAYPTSVCQNLSQPMTKRPLSWSHIQRSMNSMPSTRELNLKGATNGC